MSYQTIEQDDIDERPQQQLEFKSYLGSESAAENGTPANGPSRGPGYLRDQPASFWNVEYYQKYFDVDTQTVIQRCYTTLLPTSSVYLTAHTTPQPDLYGPFWTLTSVIFALFVTSSLASSLASYLSATEVVYNFQLLSIAVGVVYAYGIGVPVLLWIALKYLGVSEWTVIEAVSVWGYGQFIWIPVAILCVMPFDIARWVFVGVAFGLSGYWLVANVYPILATAEAKAARLLVIIVAVLHGALALTFKVVFFSYTVNWPDATSPADGSAPTPTPSESATRFIF